MNYYPHLQAKNSAKIGMTPHFAKIVLLLCTQMKGYSAFLFNFDTVLGKVGHKYTIIHDFKVRLHEW